MRTARAAEAVAIAVTLAAAVTTGHAGLAQGLQRGGTPQTDEGAPAPTHRRPDGSLTHW
jgi:hypothetical protein